MKGDVVVVVDIGKGDNELIMCLTYQHQILTSIHSLVNNYLLLLVAIPAKLPGTRRLA
jgi:hypothetical protein